VGECVGGPTAPEPNAHLEPNAQNRFVLQVKFSLKS
jgi:hypothetical protein